MKSFTLILLCLSLLASGSQAAPRLSETPQQCDVISGLGRASTEVKAIRNADLKLDQKLKKLSRDLHEHKRTVSCSVRWLWRCRVEVTLCESKP